MEPGKFKLGIVAYGSLIDEPGDELKAQIIDQVACLTPFKIEYGRISRTRGMAPTLIPVEEGGVSVGFQMYSGKSLTDRIASGVDSTVKNW